MQKKQIFIVLLSVFMIIFVMLNAEETGLKSKAEETILKGKDFVKLGKLTDLEGKLFEKDNEWFLKISEKELQLHFGPKEFLESKKVTLKKSKKFIVSGFLYQDQVAVVSFNYQKKKIELRTETGEPLWKNTEFSKKDHRHYYVVDPAKCIGCRLCVKNCPVNAIEFKNGKAIIDADKCINCGICKTGNGKNFKGCPTEAISSD